MGHRNWSSIDMLYPVGKVYVSLDHNNESQCMSTKAPPGPGASGDNQLVLLFGNTTDNGTDTTKTSTTMPLSTTISSITNLTLTYFGNRNDLIAYIQGHIQNFMPLANLFLVQLLTKLVSS
ncbi:hypothetical protein RIF29_21710 [Crotalaria pallida]|uniref:Uncharacterized protein n=1 Tax=Crotalaria pallida TaxID=3830 RepID=A0AAN9F769_CROPI